MFKSSMQKCRTIIEDRMGQLSWTGEQVSIYRSADSAEVRDLVDFSFHCMANSLRNSRPSAGKDLRNQWIKKNRIRARSLENL